MNLDLLKELVAFQRYGTLSSTAEHLMITQPTVTRGMRRLEDELGVSLFDRRVSNHIKLNETGVYAATEAAKLLKAERDFTERVLNYHHLNHEIVIGSVAPGPVILLENSEISSPAKVKINFQNVFPEKVADNLKNLKEKLIFTNQEIMTDEIESVYLGVEYLGVEIGKSNPLSKKTSVNFDDLAGMSFLVVQDTGPWQAIVENNIPDAAFLYQADLDAMSEISRNSKFPYFFFNLSLVSSATIERSDGGERVAVPIDDPRNRLEFYGSYLKSNRKLVQPLLKEINKIWPQN